jgi:Multiubiquitin
MNENEKKHGHDHGKQVLHLTINGKRYDWHEEYITGAQIKKLGDIPDNDEIFLSVKKPWEDELIGDDKKVNLALPEIEHFYSKPKERDITIIANGSPKKWDKHQISFVEVIVLAYGTYIDKPTMVYTVGYEDGPKENPEGSMVKGQVVIVKSKMIFHATATDKS